MSVKEYKLEVQKREIEGKKNLKKIRRNDGIPGVYYSYDSKESIPFTLDKKELQIAIKSGARVFNISVGGKKRNVVFKSVQYHPVTDLIQHIDLYGVKMDQEITIKATISLIGDSIGVKQGGGVLNTASTEIEVACLPLDIPESIEVDISNLEIGDSIQAGDIKLDEKLKLVSSADMVIVSVTHAMRETEQTQPEDADDTFMEEEDTSSSDVDNEKSDEGSGADSEEN